MDLKSTRPRPATAPAVILAAFVALSVCYSFATPLKFGPDEPAHFIYIRSLAIDHAPPPISTTVVSTEKSGATHEGHQPPLYYALMAIPYAAMDAAGVRTETIWRVLRLLNIGLGAVWLWFVYGLAYRFFQKRQYAPAVTALVALTPLSAYMSGVINNDIMIALFFTWALIPILAYFQSGSITNSGAARLGLLIGLAVLAKLQGLILVPAFLIAALVVLRRNGWVGWKQTARTAIIVCAIVAVVSGWWFARCAVVHGTPIPHSLYKPGLQGGIGVLPAHPVEAFGLIRMVTRTQYGYYWAPYWVMEPFVKWDIYYRPLLAITFLGLVGLVIRLRRNGDVDWRSLAFLAFPPVAAYLTWLHYVFTVDMGMMMQGRLFMPVAGIVGICAVLGLDGLLRGPRAKKAGLVAGVIVLVLANIGVIVCDLAMYAR